MKYFIQGYREVNGKEQKVLGSDTGYIMEYKRIENLKKYGMAKVKKGMERHNATIVKVFSFTDVYDESTYKLVADLYTRWLPDKLAMTKDKYTCDECGKYDHLVLNKGICKECHKMHNNPCYIGNMSYIDYSESILHKVDY